MYNCIWNYMFKRTADVSCSLKESIDGLEIIVCDKMFHCTIVCGKNDHLYISFCVTSSVTSMIDTLGWPILAERRLKTRLIMMYKITHALIAIPNNILIPTDSRTRKYQDQVVFSKLLSSLGIQYSFKTLKITYCCMRGYLQKYLHKFHKVK
jgi:hypothetical protein